MIKKYTHPSATAGAKNISSVKEQSSSVSESFTPRYATDEMVKKAVSKVMRLHGAALQKLAQ